MAKKLTVVVSQGQSQNPEKRGLEEGLVAELLFDKNVELVVVPHLYDLKADGTGVIALQGVPGDMVVLSWLFPRAAHWTLDRLGVKGRVGTTLLKDPAEASEEDEDFDEEEAEANAQAKNGESEPPATRGVGAKNVPGRYIWCLDLRIAPKPGPFVEEIRRIAREAAAPVIGMSLGLAAPKPKPAAPPNGATANGAATPTPAPIS
ncbi:MAG TPA: ferredoxin family protein, partial [Pirellulales bacterium]